jgi:hypothetical protein
VLERVASRIKTLYVKRCKVAADECGARQDKTRVREIYPSVSGSTEHMPILVPCSLSLTALGTRYRAGVCEQRGNLVDELCCQVDRRTRAIERHARAGS